MENQNFINARDFMIKFNCYVITYKPLLSQERLLQKTKNKIIRSKNVIDKFKHKLKQGLIPFDCKLTYVPIYKMRIYSKFKYDYISERTEYSSTGSYHGSVSDSGDVEISQDVHSYTSKNEYRDEIETSLNKNFASQYYLTKLIENKRLLKISSENSSEVLINKEYIIENFDKLLKPDLRQLQNQARDEGGKEGKVINIQLLDYNYDMEVDLIPVYTFEYTFSGKKYSFVIDTLKGDLGFMNVLTNQFPTTERYKIKMSRKKIKKSHQSNALYYLSYFIESFIAGLITTILLYYGMILLITTIVGNTPDDLNLKDLFMGIGGVLVFTFFSFKWLIFFVRRSINPFKKRF